MTAYILTVLESFKNYPPMYQILTITIICCISYLFILSVCKKAKNNGKRPPGPVGIPFLGYLPFLGSEPWKTLWKLKDKYGDIMSLYMGQKYTIILSEYEIAKEVLSHSAALDRAPEHFESLPCIGFQVENGESWVEQRRFCLSATRDLGLGRGPWEELITDEVSTFTEKLIKTKGKPTNISDSLAQSISSNIISLLIGRKLNKDEEADKIKLSLEFSEVAFTYMGPSKPASVVPGLRKVLEFFRIHGYHRAAQIVEKFGSFVKEEILRHKVSSELHGIEDFINFYLKKIESLSKSGSSNHYFSEYMLRGNLSILFLGASDTIFSSLTWLMRLMADHKDIQDKVHEELMEVLGKDGRAKYGERDKIPYTFAVLMEGQRFSSIVPISTTRRLIEDVNVMGYNLLKGADVAANLWGLHNDPKYWKDPELFFPDRFLTDNGTKLAKNPPSYAPFSMGRRNCPGERIAWREILGYFTEIVKKFEIGYPEGVQPKYEIVSGLVTHLKPQVLCFKQRKEASN